ncbi:MAG: 4-hydroxythreonine-4-phosphate dehydrogenase PdxA [Gammaproteobacteria bacterium]|nr:4-hydroxythreonine-4-phosphate dehydrogenase PdxA [Gammaproteobacteria bacterium]
MTSSSPVIAITPGEPAGIGPDIVLHYAQQALAFPCVVIADQVLLRQRAQQLQLPIHLHDYVVHQPPRTLPAQHLYVWHTPLAQACTAGELNPANAPYVLDCLRRAVQGCLQQRFGALVTGPVHKGVINNAGITFTGHTEFLAEHSSTPQVVMLLSTPGLRVALATTHLPLSQVSAHITRASLETTLRIIHTDLQQRFGIQHPHITVCGLNPHAGEQGHLGREEIDTILPVLKSLRAEGFDLEGPLPADTAFIAPIMQRTDVYLAMYHDQGLPVLKHLGFGNAVNITLGLPFIRTSVDHGTALDRAGRGPVDLGSLVQAIEVAQQLLRHAP